MNSNKKNILILVLAGFFLFSFSAFVLADKQTEVTYPDVPGAIRPTTIQTPLGDYIKYVFNFAIIISGLIAFAALIYGGFRYVASVGSPTALTDAQGQMFAGIIGLVILLSSYLILTTINPQLVIFKPSIPVDWGVIIYKGDNCSDQTKDITKDTFDLGSDFNDKIRSLKFRATPGTLDINIYPDVNYQGSAQFLSSDNQSCMAFSGSAKSIKFTWKIPGVYLVNNSGQEKYLPGSTATLGDFNDNVKEVKFRNVTGANFGAVLHENQDYKGECDVFLADDGNLSDNLIKDRTSSVATFSQSADFVGDGVYFCENDNYGGWCEGPYKPLSGQTAGWTPWVGDIWGGHSNQGNDSITSIKIQGNYLAVLFDNQDYTGTCQVFNRSDANLRNDPIGRCGCGPFGWGCNDCLSSFGIISTK